MSKKIINIVLTGGGTAGHVWPHFALFEGDKSPLARAFKENKLQVYYIGSKEGMERHLVKSTNPTWKYYSIATGKLRRYFSWENFTDFFRIIYGFFEVFFLLGRIKPKAVFSKGGFVSAPVVWAAWLRSIPIIIHESDATPALATLLTIPFCRIALFAFGETIPRIPSLFRKKCLEVGLPIRESLFSALKEESLHYFSLTTERKTLLIFGGSLGALSLNKKMFDIIPELVQKYNIIHIVGKNNKNSNIAFENYKQFEFLKEDMRYAYGASDLAICRAGASSIFELAAARIPMILIPLGLHASRGDQLVNARIFASKAWAQWSEENQFQKENAIQMIEKAMSELSERKNALENAPNQYAAVKVSELIWDIIQKNEHDI